MITHPEAVHAALRAIVSCGGRAWPRNVGLFRDVRGNPRKVGVRGEADVQGLVPGGRALAVEVKTGAAERTPEQRAWGRMWVAMGGLYVVARYSDSDDGDAAIRAAIEDHLATVRGAAA